MSNDTPQLPVPGPSLWMGIVFCALILAGAIYWLSTYAGTAWL